MTKSEKKHKELLKQYYKKVLLQFIGLEKEVYQHVQGSVKFYHRNSILILWTGANKIQEAKSGKWISNADKYIIENVLTDKSAPLFTEYNLQP